MNNEEIYSSFKKRVMYRKISNFVMPVGVILVLAAQVIQVQKVLIGSIGGLVIAIGAAISLKYWKCPNCNNYLPTKYKPDSIEQCEHCGTRLRE